MTYPIQGEEVVPPSPATGSGQQNPYRGFDVHGVPSPAVWQDVPAPTGETTKVEIAEQPKEQDPVPVYVVEQPDASKQRIIARFHWEFVDNVRPIRILTRDDRRTKARIKLNEGAGVRVWIYNTESVSQWNGYPLDGGGEFETDIQGQLWCIADAPPDPRKVVVYEEIADPI